MNVGMVLYVLGRLCTLLSLLLCAPLLLCGVYGGFGTMTAQAFLVTAAMSLGLGWALRLSFAFDQTRFGFGEAFATVVASWLVFMGLGALPYLITGSIPGVLDAFFETLSGFTTTGASILPDPGTLDPPLLFWRAMTHWIGGMGIVALSVAVLPVLGAGGNFLFQAEMPGPESEKLMPRISSTAKLLWSVYLALTASEFALLWWAGMTPFESICHTFATVSTGGFGTEADSVAGYAPSIQWIIVGFMLLSGVNFVMLYNVLRGRAGVALRNTEVRTYLALLLVVSGLCLGVLARDGLPDGGLEPVARDAVFTTVSLATCTGFVNNDYSDWPALLHLALLLSMCIGGCAGSTSGGWKVQRLVVAAKIAVREVRRLLRPSAVFVVKVGRKPVDERLIDHTVGYYVLYMVCLVVATVALMLLSLGFDTSISAVITCMSNVGPGLGAVGPAENFALISAPGKMLLMACMLLGRLEFYSVIVLFMPLAWRR